MKNHDIEALFRQIIAGDLLGAVFQPIVALNKQSLYGYEGLVRGPSGTLLHDPESLFEVAGKLNSLCDLDWRCAKTVIGQFARLRLPGRLFLNVNAGSFAENQFNPDRLYELLRQCDINPRRIVIEINDSLPPQDWEVMGMAIHRYRELEFGVALNELDAADLGLRLWSEIKPDFVKIDRRHVETQDEDQAKTLFINAILKFTQSLHCKLIAVGVENKQEYAALRKMGVDLAQGYYFGEPQAQPELSTDKQLFSSRQNRDNRDLGPTLACLTTAALAIPPNMELEMVGDLFQKHLELRCMPVVDRGRPLGLVLRSELMNILASRYGRDLHGRKPVRKFVNQKTIVLEKTLPLEMASKHITSNASHHTEDFIITDNGHFSGMGCLLDLLRRITEIQITNARYANPLTLLPGNVLINQTLADRLADQDDFALAYCDLDHFKAFNDIYGYGHGDEVIRLVGRLLQECANLEKDFVGHIGGDDFLIVFRSANWRARCEKLLNVFGQIIPGHYTAQDRLQGYVESTDRFGEKRQIPLMSLSVGVIAVKGPHQQLDLDRITEMASASKSKAKKIAGNSLTTDFYSEKDARKDRAQASRQAPLMAERA